MSNHAPEKPDKLTLLSNEPLVGGLALSAMDQWETPADRFFVRNHFPIPRLDTATWRLSVSGEVNRPLSFSYEELQGLPSREVASLLECAGNSRATVQPPVEGLLWDHGGVSSGRWKGVSVQTVLERAGLKDAATEVLFEGADHGKERHADQECRFAMSLPLDKALHPDTLLAYEMNGAPLTQEHGFPLRLLVPGWYGMTSVKWLTSIQVLSQPFSGFHQTEYYVFQEEGTVDGLPKERVTAMEVKSLITSPGRGAALAAGKNVIWGVAWSGAGPVTRVEVSTDNGRTWEAAQLQESRSPYAWQQWEFPWEASTPGYYLVQARATDAQGRTQPEKAPWNFRGFANNSIQVVPVQVR